MNIHTKTIFDKNIGTIRRGNVTDNIPQYYYMNITGEYKALNTRRPAGGMQCPAATDMEGPYICRPIAGLRPPQFFHFPL
jgi:hypothetical protein